MTRPSITRELAQGLRVTVEQLPPRRGFRAITQAAKCLGPVMAGLLSGGISDPESGQVVTLAEAVSTSRGRNLLAERALEAAEALSVDDAMLLADELLAGQVTINGTRIDCPPTPEGLATWREALDLLLPDAWAMIGLVRLALELNLRPTSPGGRTDPGTPAAG